jgi:chromate transporter
MILLELAGHFALMSLLSVGGSTVVLPEIYRFLVESHHWLTSQAFAALFAISQAAPGPNVLFVALFGWQIAGFFGAWVSLMAMCGPSSLLALLVEHYVGNRRDLKWMTIVRHALSPLTIGLLISTGVILIRSADHSAGAIGLTAVTVLVCLRTQWNPLWLIAAGGVLGMMGWV